MRVPLIFAVVVAAVAALVIFFGAWAVSVNASSPDRELSFVGPSLNAGSEAGSRAIDAQSASAESGSAGTLAETWWGDALIVVCPFH